MNFEVIVTCAVTGAGDTVGKHPGVPVTPEQIAQAAIDAAKAGATAAHLHVRDPQSGKGSRDPVAQPVDLGEGQRALLVDDVRVVGVVPGGAGQAGGG